MEDAKRKHLAAVIPNRVRALRMERGWSMKALAERAQTGPSTIMKLEQSSQRLTLEWIDRLAAAFQVSPIELVSDDPVGSVRMVRVVGTIAAGNWAEAVERSDEEIPVPEGLIRGARSFALRPTGDSMNKVLPEGAYVLVDPDDSDLRDGKIYAVMNGEGETTVKRYRADPSRLEPCSTNPNHQPIMLGRAPFTVVGRVTSTIAEL